MKSKNFNLTFNLMIISALFVSLMGFILAHGGGEVTNSYNENMMSGDYGNMFGMGFLGFLIIVLVIIALILFIAWMIKNLKENKK